MDHDIYSFPLFRPLCLNARRCMLTGSPKSWRCRGFRWGEEGSGGQWLIYNMMNLNKLLIHSLSSILDILSTVYKTYTWLFQMPKWAQILPDVLYLSILITCLCIVQKLMTNTRVSPPYLLSCESPACFRFNAFKWKWFLWTKCVKYQKCYSFPNQTFSN